MTRPFVLAIDGPAGAGKSTTARGVASRLGLLHVDSGAMYRAVGVAARRSGIPLEDEGRLLELTRAARFELGPDGLSLNGSLLGEEIRTGEAGEAASQVAVHPRLRARLVSLQRSLARPPGLVMEGRDIGTVVFPNADLKIFVSASPEARARRRWEELRRRGESADLTAIEAAIRERDCRDEGRAVGPLTRPPDSLPLDTTHLSVDLQVDLASHWTELARRPVPRMSFIYRAGHDLVAGFARTCLLLRVTGLEHVPRKGPLLVASNHVSFWDPPLVGSLLPREAHFLAKEELFRNRLFGTLISLYNSIPIRRGPQARAALRGAEEVLASGGAVIIFPEGTRSRSGDFLPPRAGVARLAAYGRAPVLPVCISGSNQIRRSILRRTPVRVSFGPAMMPPVGPGEDRAADRAYARGIMEAIAALREEPRRSTWK
ncbi:MAG TPA: (d)CMP kinase [Candidatus Eisenbacteria bacterium]